MIRLRRASGGGGDKPGGGTTGADGLDSDFAAWLDDYTEQMLGLHAAARPSPRTADVWGCRNLGDFMCGFFVGEMLGAATSTFQSRYGRAPSAEEHAAITGVVERHARGVRDAFLRYNH